jgi:hypothetical protein
MLSADCSGSGSLSSTSRASASSCEAASTCQIVPVSTLPAMPLLSLPDGLLLHVIHCLHSEILDGGSASSSPNKLAAVRGMHALMASNKRLACHVLTATRPLARLIIRPGTSWLGVRLVSIAPQWSRVRVLSRCARGHRTCCELN